MSTQAVPGTPSPLIKVDGFVVPRWGASMTALGSEDTYPVVFSMYFLAVERKQWDARRAQPHRVYNELTLHSPDWYMGLHRNTRVRI